MKNGKNGKRLRLNSSFSRQELTRGEEYELFERIKRGDKSAENRIVEAHYGFICDIASHFRGPDWNDLVQEGALGMMVAIQKFDNTRGNRFITYAGFWVRAYMIIAVKEHYQGKRSPGSGYVAMREIRKQTRLYSNLYGRCPTIEELSNMTSIKKSIIVRTLNCDKPMPSIGLVRDDDNLLGWQLNYEIIADTETPSPAELIEEREKREFIQSVEAELREVLKKSISLERDIDITFAHLLDDVEMAELGRKHNISRERVRQIKERSIRILRRILFRRRSEFTEHYVQS